MLCPALQKKQNAMAGMLKNKNAVASNTKTKKLSDVLWLNTVQK